MCCNIKMKKQIILIVIILSFWILPGYCQDSQNLLGETVKLYTENQVVDKSLIKKGSPAGMIAGFLFATIGFVAFVYGKKNTRFQPMIIGIILMVYPYFVSNTLVLCLMGIVLTVFLFVFRE